MLISQPLHATRLFRFALAVIFILSLSVTFAARAATLVGTTSEASGINGLLVDGALYDVTFVHDSYEDVYSATAPFFLGNSNGALDAAIALANALNSFGVTGLTGAVIANNDLVAVIPASVSGTGYTGSAAGFTGSNWGGTGLTATCMGCTGVNFDNADQAIFALATPIPAALALFTSGLGVLGLIGCRWKIKRIAPLAA